MALLHAAELTPSKLDLLRDWMPTQPWYVGSAAPELTQLGSYRFDDPAGEVGIETIIVRVDEGAVFQVPLTYRAAPVDGLETHLIRTMKHSVLGDRWVYSGTGDPVYAVALAETILAGGRQADLVRDDGTSRASVEPSVHVAGSGQPGTPVGAVELLSTSHTDGGTLLETSVTDLVVIPRLDSVPSVSGDQTLTGTWGEHAAPTLLAVARPR